jgi:hypothetical protein
MALTEEQRVLGLLRAMRDLRKQIEWYRVLTLTAQLWPPGPLRVVPGNSRRINMVVGDGPFTP